MKIVVIGANGTIGKAVVAELNPRHDIISAGRKNVDIQVDITEKASISNFYKKIKDIDAVILATGKVHFGALEEMDTADYGIGLTNKLMGQVNVVLAGLKYVNEQASFTLTSGILNRDPIRYGSSAAMINGALNGFVKSAAIEMPRRIRINSVSPTVVTEAMQDYSSYFRGYASVSAAKVALSYSKSVEGLQTGQIYEVLG